MAVSSERSERHGAQRCGAKRSAVQRSDVQQSSATQSTQSATVESGSADPSPTAKDEVKRGVKDISTNARFSMFRAKKKLLRKADW